jgi:chorismate dehydratase
VRALARARRGFQNSWRAAVFCRAAVKIPTEKRPVAKPQPFRVASVSYLNAKPLICGLEREPAVRLSLAVPSKLLDALRDGSADVALLPVIDFQRLDGLTVVPAGGIGSDGATLTVRIFSRVPVGQIRSLACDPDSHTSVALARIILSRRYGLRPEFQELTRTKAADAEMGTSDAEKGTSDAEKGTSRISGDAFAGSSDRRTDILDVSFFEDPHQARLLIGDKVVCEEPAGFPHQLDLGAEWKALTGLPFLFATWMARSEVPDLPRLGAILEQAKALGLARVEQIIAAHAEPRGWPRELARQYRTRHLTYHVGERELEAVRLFHRLAVEEGVIPAARPLAIVPPAH